MWIIIQGRVYQDYIRLGFEQRHLFSFGLLFQIREKSVNEEEEGGMSV